MRNRPDFEKNLNNVDVRYGDSSSSIQAINSISNMCKKGKKNFYFLPCASLCDKKKISIPIRSCLPGDVVINALYINGVKVNKIPTNKGVSYCLKPGTYTIKLDFTVEFDETFEYDMYYYKEYKFKKNYIEESKVYIYDDSDITYLVLNYGLQSRWEKQYDRYDICDRYHRNPIPVYKFVRFIDWCYFQPMKKDDIDAQFDESWIVAFDNEYYFEPNLNVQTVSSNKPVINKVEPPKSVSTNTVAKDYNDVVVYKYSDGSMYLGHMRGFTKYGFGIYLFTNGNIFCGQFNDVRNGYGFLKYYDNEVVICKYLNDRQNEVYLKIPNHTSRIFKEFDSTIPCQTVQYTGGIYCGQRKQGQLHGFGEFKFNDGDTYIGTWLLGMPCGLGAYKYANGDYAIGTFMSYKLNGYGIYVYSDGNYLYGLFENGRYIVK